MNLDQTKRSDHEETASASRPILLAEDNAHDVVKRICRNGQFPGIIR